MSDTDDTKENAMLQESEAVELPPQQSATDTSNRDNKVSTNPIGEEYVRADESYDSKD